MGFLINIEGTDGSGKATQAKLLKESLLQQGYRVAVLDFPRYKSSSSLLVRQYLAGRFGQASEVPPKTASAFFAMDRFLTAPKIKSLLEKNDVVILDRYVAANKGHQLGKIQDHKQRLEFLNWLNELEYKENRIPIPNITLLLYLPLLFEQNRASSAAKGGVKQDIHESDQDHLKQAEEAYLWVSKHDKVENWVLINCLDANQNRLSPKLLQQIIWQNTVKPVLVI